MAGALIEVAFEPPRASSPQQAIAELAGAAGVAAVATPVEHTLIAEYFDTAARSLAAAGISLERRQGSDAAGWHLKLPDSDADACTEVVMPLRSRSRKPPQQLLDTVAVHLRDQQVSSAAMLHVQRSLTRLLDAEARVVAEVRDDTIAAEGAAGESRAWRQWGLALPADSPEVLQAVRHRLSAAGAGELSGRARLSRLLDADLPAPAPQPELRKHGPARPIVHRRLAEQVASIKQLDPRVRSDLPDSVHDMRVALRRLRSALATFRPFLDRGVTDPMRDELRWIAGLLGDARDSGVLRDRLLALIADEPEDLVVGPVAQRVEQELSNRYRDALATAVQAMESSRYYALIDGLDGLIADPPWTPAASKPADKRLRRRVNHDRKRVLRSVAAVGTGDPEQRDRQLHEVRKAAKRARYAAEALVPVYGRDARRFAKANKRVQSVLGDHNDSAVARRELLEIAERARLDGEDTFSYGRLHALEQARGAAHRQRFHRVWRKAARRKLNRWLE